MNSEKTNKEEGLYAYIKEHPTILISIISGVVIIVGFLFRVLIYMNECRYLEYWHLNKLMINIIEQNQLYEMVTISFLYLSIILIQFLVSATLNHYQNRTQVIGYNKILLKSVKKEFKRIKKEHIINHKSSKKMEKVAQLRDEQDKIVVNFGANIGIYENCSKNLHKQIFRKNIMDVLFAFIFSSMSLAGTTYLCFTISSSVLEWKIYFLTLVLFVFMIWGMSYAGVLLTRFVVSLPFKRKSIEEKEKICNQKMEDYLENKEDYVLNKIINFNIKHYINRKNLFLYFAYAIIIFITFVGFINKSKTNEMINNSTFGIIEYDDFKYAIIYRDDSFIYLEECRISDNKITIFVDKQKRIENGVFCHINREFDEVFRVDFDGNLLE